VERDAGCIHARTIDRPRDVVGKLTVRGLGVEDRAIGDEGRPRVRGEIERVAVRRRARHEVGLGRRADLLIAVGVPSIARPMGSRAIAALEDVQQRWWAQRPRSNGVRSAPRVNRGDARGDRCGLGSGADHGKRSSIHRTPETI
jgi:hypothetical protein